MPGRTKVTKMIDELYEDMMLKLKDMLKQSSSVSLTTDAAKMPTGDWISSENLRSAQSGGPIINLLVEDVQDDGEHQVNEELGLEGPADNDWSTAQLLCHFMKPFQAVTDYLQGKTWADHPKAVSCMRDFVIADIKRCWDTGNLLLGMAAVVDPLHISLEWLTPLQQQTIKQQLLQEMFAVAGVPSDNDALEKDGSNVPNPTKRKRFEDYDFLDDYDD
eukprot:Em0013g420a